MCDSEGKERSRGQDKAGNQKVEDYRGEEEKEEARVPPTTLERGTSRECYPFGGCWRFSGHEN